MPATRTNGAPGNVRAGSAGPEPLVKFMRSDRPARLLVVTSGYPSEQRPGRVVFIARQVRSLAGRGFPADVLVIGGARSTAAYPRAAAALVARRAWSRNPYGLVHAHGGEAAIAARFYPGVPLLVSYLGSDLLGTDGSGRARGPRAAAVRAAALSAQAVIVKSEAMLAALPRRVARRARVIPTGVDLELFAPRSRAMARAALGWAEEERVALFAADPSLPYKRFELAERACRIAAVEVGPVRLRVAHGIAPNDVPTMMNAADCLLHPSATEGSANVIKEAMACNLPVVATPVGDAPQRLNGVTPSFVCPPDAELLARAVAVCLRSPQRSNGRQHCASVSDEHVSAAVAGVYRELLGLARQPGRS